MGGRGGGRLPQRRAGTGAEVATLASASQSLAKRRLSLHGGACAGAVRTWRSQPRRRAVALS
jgi:hypothetical protein